MSRGFVSPELEAAVEYLDGFIQAQRPLLGTSDKFDRFITDLRDLRHAIEGADIDIDRNTAKRGGA
jgi:hypothetical protein